MRRLLPSSLRGQILLAVALALLVAQTISGALLLRAEQNRREQNLINELAFQLITEPRGERQARGGRRGPPIDERREERRRLRMERLFTNPQRDGEVRDTQRELSLSDVLAREGVRVGKLVVIKREVRSDKFVQGRLEARPRLLRDRWRADGKMVLAGLQRVGSEQWLIARVPLPPPAPRAAWGVLIQTVVLYLVLLGVLAFLLSRITRPLAALTSRVEIFGTSRDVTPPLEESGPADTRRLIAAHNAMVSRIAALLDEKDVMLGAIGHDLKTPLAALRVRIESVADDAERTKMARGIEDITRTLDDILSLARVGRPSDPLERTDLGALVASVVEEYEDMGRDVGLTQSERIALPLRATWLRRALRNLVSNALRYGQQARVALAREGGQAVIRIADKGPGIPDGEIAQMLEPFTRGEASRNRATGGAGLGLTLARAIAEQHGGELKLANRIGENGNVEGLVAELRLPLA